MTDIVERLRQEPLWAGEAIRLAAEAADEIEKSRRSADYWKREHNAANAEIERLRAALREISGMPFDVADGRRQMKSIAKKALGHE